MLVLVRDTKTDKAILGHIVLDDALICYTCENREKAITVGLYSLQNSISPKFKRELPLIYGDKVAASRGCRCVLVGMSRNCVAGTISESKNAETMITMLCRNICQLAIVDNT